MTPVIAVRNALLNSVTVLAQELTAAVGPRPPLSASVSTTGALGAPEEDVCEAR